MYELIADYGLALVALLVFIGELGIPTGVPAEIALLLVGSQSIHSAPELIFGVLLVSLADLLGTTALNVASRTGGFRLLGLVYKHREEREKMAARWRARFRGHDTLAVFVMRLIPVLRMWSAVGTGLIRVPLRSYLIGAAPAALLWSGTPVVLGYLFRERINYFEHQYTLLTAIVLGLGVAGALVTVLGWWVQRGISTAAKMMRARFLVGGTAGIVALVHFANTARANHKAALIGAETIPPIVLAACLAVLAVVAAGLIWQAVHDVKLAVLAHESRQASLRVDPRSIVLWLGLIVMLAGVIAWTEMRYPTV